MKAKGLRVFGVLVILVGIIAGVVALLLSGFDTMGILALGLSTLIGVVIACILFAVANNKEKRERIRASMEAVEDATVLDPIEEPVVDDVLAETDAEIEELPEFNPEEDLAVEPVEDVELPKTKYQILRDKIVEHTPITYEQLDKAEKVGKVALPVAAAATLVLMVAKLASYRKQEIRRRTFFDWLG